jgi:ParB family chromosome partitioning protein
MLQDDIAAGRLRMGHARALLSLESEDAQKEVRDRIVAEGLSVRETEALIRARKRRPAAAKPAKPAHLQVIEQTLHQRFGARVAIKPGRKRGKIEISYQGEEDLQRLLSLLQP